MNQSVSTLVTSGSSLSSSAPGYDFSSLDRLLDWLHTYRLYPGFELMGNPSQLFTDFSDDTQVAEWRRLVGIIATRYIGMSNPWPDSAMTGGWKHDGIMC